MSLNRYEVYKKIKYNNVYLDILVMHHPSYTRFKQNQHIRLLMSEFIIKLLS